MRPIIGNHHVQSTHRPSIWFDASGLLPCHSIKLDLQSSYSMIRGQRVLVTGACGAIGSELCRQLVTIAPSELALVDLDESRLVLIYKELTEQAPDLRITPILGNVCHRSILRRFFDRVRPQIVFHAAAYTNVLLMEQNPWSAFVNNIGGIRSISDLAFEYDVERLLLISTDKVVRPASMVGVTRRLSEMLLCVQPQQTGAIFNVMRLGNDLCSPWSVVHKFQSQIQAGDPVTITHPDVTRFHLPVSDAVQFLLRAVTLNDNKAIYVPEMGEQVSILRLGQDMIRIYQRKHDKSVEISYMGLRPGEKLHSELCEADIMHKTGIEGIWRVEEPGFNEDVLTNEIDILLDSLYSMPLYQFINTLKRLVPTFSTNSTSLDQVK